MNRIKTLDTYYLRPDRTVNAIMVTHPDGREKLVFEYNREGLYFKLFTSFPAVFAYFLEDDGQSFEREFYSEEAVDRHLLHMNDF